MNRDTPRIHAPPQIHYVHRNPNPWSLFILKMQYPNGIERRRRGIIPAWGNAPELELIHLRLSKPVLLTPNSGHLAAENK
jgi:hypothetical protein